MKKLLHLFSLSWFPYVALVLLTIPTFLTLIRPGFFFMQDDLQAFRIHQMDKCFQDFQLPCRWVPDPGYQYGYPQFLYYPPSVYYLGEILHLVGFQFIDAVKILFALGFILSAITMYVFLKTLFGKWPAMVGALLYTYVPYKAVDVYVRGAMSEFWALVFFPLILWAAYQTVQSKERKYIAWLALSVGLLLTTHNLMSIVFLPIAGVWSLTWLILKKEDFKATLLRLVVGGLLGVGIAAFFSLSVVFEKQYAHLETLVGGYFDYRQHFVNIERLFFSTIWGYGSSNLGQTEELSLSTGVIQWMFGLLGAILAIINFKKHRSLVIATLVLAVAALFTLFMIHQKSSFIWSLIPMLEYLQFPWRLLANSIFFLSFLSAAAIYFMKDLSFTLFQKKIKASYLIGILAVILAISLYGSIFRPRDWSYISDQDKFSGKSWEKQLTISIFDYLPIYSKFPPIVKAPEKPEVLEGIAQFPVYKKGSDSQEGIVKVEKDALIRVPLFDFPGMVVKVDNKKVVHWHDDCRGQEFCLGLITFNVPQGDHKIKVELTKTPIRLVGDLVSFLSISTVIFLFVGNKVAKVKKYEKAPD